MMRLDKVTRAAVDALEDVKARDISVFDVKKMTAFFDTVIVATGESNRQCRALASRVQEGVKAAGGKIYGVEGEKTGEWLLVDMGSTVVHIMQPAIRQYYNLEELWATPGKSGKFATSAKPATADPLTRRVKARKAAKVAKPAKAAKVSKVTKVSKVSKATVLRKPVARRKRAPRRSRAKTA